MGGHVDVVNYLVVHNCNVNHKRKSDGFTALILAAQIGNFEILQLLLLKGANKEEADNEKRTALYWAVDKGHINIVKHLLVTSGANIRVIDIEGDTVMHLATLSRRMDMIKLLTEQGGDIDTKNKIAMTPLLTAARNGLTNIVMFLYSYGASLFSQNDNGFTALQRAVANGHRETVQYLLSVGANAKVEQDPNYTKLHFVLAYAPEAAIKILAQADKETLHKADGEGNTPLHYAAGFSSPELLQELLQRSDFKKDVKKQNKYGYTPLHMAMFLGVKTFENTKLLLMQGADVNCVDVKNNTPVHIAIEFSRDFKIIQLLVSRVNIHHKNNNGDTPLALAQRLNLKQEIVKYLLEYEQKTPRPLTLPNVIVAASVATTDKSVNKNNNNQISTWVKAPPIVSPEQTAFFTSPPESTPTKLNNEVNLTEAMPELIDEDDNKVAIENNNSPWQREENKALYYLVLRK